jgi:YwiC-like protein
MATSPGLQPAASARVRLLTFPREHGAWGILLVPLTAGAAVGFQDYSTLIPTFLLATVAVSLFCLRTPVESLAGTSTFHPQSDSERRAVVSSIVAYSSVAALALATLLWLEREWNLVLLGAAVAAIFLGQALLKKLGRELRLSAQWVGSLGLTSTAAAAYYVAAGKMDATSFALWATNWLFAANQIHFVQLRIHSARAATRAEKLARGRWFLIGEALLILILVVGWQLRLIPALALLALAPVLVRGLTWTFSSRTAPLEVRRLGKSELAHAILFGVLIIMAFRFGRI